MATLQVNALLNRVSTILQDNTNIRWTQAELLDWLNDGQREVVKYKPNACVKNVDMTLVAGTKQSIPADGVLFLNLTRNSGATGTAIRVTAREVLDAQIPDWHATSRANAKVVHFCFNPQDPTTFYVYPPSPGNNQVEVVYSASPTNAQLGGVISIADIYGNVLIDFCLYRGYLKDAEYAANDARSQQQYERFMQGLAGQASAESSANPNALNGNPNVIK